MVSLVPGRAAGDAPSGAVIADVFWALVDADGGLEHIRVSMSDSQADLILFLAVVDPGRVEDVALGLVRRVLAVAPALRGWSVDKCGQVDVGFWLEP
ncbi:hypothetical protein [Kutzneria sp. NPDC052558]|uniref:hypothetical protein n=1 Tax=Kutzneria sp. NPDC052558 TaxID=3364121 RepID=UPI0037CB80FD